MTRRKPAAKKAASRRGSQNHRSRPRAAADLPETAAASRAAA